MLYLPIHPCDSPMMHKQRTPTPERSHHQIDHIRTRPSVLRGEAEIYKSLARGTGSLRIRLLLNECGYYCMVFDPLGPSLEDQFQFYGRGFSSKNSPDARRPASWSFGIYSFIRLISSIETSSWWIMLDGNGYAGQHRLYHRVRYCNKTSSYTGESQCQPSFTPSKVGWYGTFCQRQQPLVLVSAAS